MLSSAYARDAPPDGSVGVSISLYESCTLRTPPDRRSDEVGGAARKWQVVSPAGFPPPTSQGGRHVYRRSRGAGRGEQLDD
jgi:hypothetical protein